MSEMTVVNGSSIAEEQEGEMDQEWCEITSANHYFSCSSPYSQK